MPTNISQFFYRSIYNTALYARRGSPKSLTDYLLKAQAIDDEVTQNMKRTRCSKMLSDQLAESSTRCWITPGWASTGTVWLPVPEAASLNETNFLRPVLKDLQSKVLSRNVYWLSSKLDFNDWDNSTWYNTPVTSYADYTSLQSVSRPRLPFCFFSNFPKINKWRSHVCSGSARES